jgi:hypothetical protein
MEVIMRGGKKWSRGITAYDRDFDTNVTKRNRQRPVESIAEE